ncbi:MAG: translation initiation factor IF-1 [Sandaracinaceae bacterium]|nr:MAG: translation initiation factor IF-1 [Sandaracinaceae bacterium]HBQ12343.1 translation initiation factor IF-1 [Myxococcales bacterium]
MSELEGIIDEALPRGLYAVRLDDGRTIRATLSTQAKRITVKVLPGDRVLVEISTYDPSRGRIKARL